jgi:hypothetical protein
MAEPETDDPVIDFPVVRVEVNVSAAIQLPDGHLLGSNMVDTTLAFGWRTGQLPVGLSDERINEALAAKISPVLSLIQTNLTFNGWVFIGQIDDPMVVAPHQIVGTGRAIPVTVQVIPVAEAKGRPS